MSKPFVDTVQHEIAEEKAEALGRTGTRLEVAVEHLLAHDSAPTDGHSTTMRDKLLWDLAERVEALIVQREACGLRDVRSVLDFFRVPGEAIARVGAKRPARLL